MAVIFLLSLTAATVAELSATGTAPQAAGFAMEGKEQRFGIAGSVLFGSVSTLTSTGAVNSMHDSYTAIGGMLPMINMMLGEVAPGGVGSGLYGMLVLAVVTVFVSGLLVGRTPEYLGKRIGAREIKLASLYILTMPALVLMRHGPGLLGRRRSAPTSTGPRSSTPASTACPRCCTRSPRPPTTTARPSPASPPTRPGSTPHSVWRCCWDASCPSSSSSPSCGAFAAQDRVPATAGTLPTDRVQSTTLLVGVTVIVTALTFFPVLALGPLAEGLL